MPVKCASRYEAARRHSTRLGFHGTNSRSRSKLGIMTETRTSLLRRVRNPSDAASWAEFVALYEPLLLSYVRKRGLNDHDVRDVVQIIFITLLRKLPSFELDKSRGRFRTWLWKVSHNAVVDHARSNKRRSWIPRCCSEKSWKQRASRCTISTT